MLSAAANELAGVQIAADRHSPVDEFVNGQRYANELRWPCERNSLMYIRSTNSGVASRWGAKLTDISNEKISAAASD